MGLLGLARVVVWEAIVRPQTVFENDDKKAGRMAFFRAIASGILAFGVDVAVTETTVLEMTLVSYALYSWLDLAGVRLRGKGREQNKK